MTVSKLYNCKQCNWYVAINFCFVFSLVYGINTAFLPCIKTFPFSETRIKNAFKRICQSFRTSAEQARRYQVRSNYVLRAWYYRVKSYQVLSNYVLRALILQSEKSTVWPDSLTLTQRRCLFRIWDGHFVGQVTRYGQHLPPSFKSHSPPPRAPEGWNCPISWL